MASCSAFGKGEQLRSLLVLVVLDEKAESGEWGHGPLGGRYQRHESQLRCCVSWLLGVNAF